ncbi:ABC transporter permease [Ligilactobacillus equi]|uniref:Glycine/betaine ABC transporter permease n=1 Tax=Ligilactobacillus equi DPC 6820 TaxID=1392007 RepID=V7I0R9_9LACO|nr:ABC transporter permease [Ligilactobacillus equi]ETA75150.1 glycine/betaine ABC transporter permease [Ligilactobacillus equi DPC 6820]
MKAYFIENYAELLAYTGQQLILVVPALVMALIIALSLISWGLKHPQVMTKLVYFFSVLYAVPSYAFFALLIPFLGLGMPTAIVVLTLYSEYILLRTLVTGLEEIDPSLVEAARGLGLTTGQIFTKIQLPLLVPAIFSGLRVALAAAMGSATIAATISAGGLGQVLFTGLQMQDINILLVGTFLTVALTLLLLLGLWWLEKIMTPQI